ncbi:YhgE/Pip family protein [Leucobacter ruminantium]|uniref:YhgE/Pip family protein n=1 Tax=Leucobacter ruminantium TaxID=1289170 RepID=A0A939RYK0_9MICO|nr:YhgE/Pip family protein [Leucobacter ruminantium]MBO1804951.1 YhgE/Pip family protein [Leucobacter ruminantium]
MSLEMTSLRSGRRVGWSRVLGLILVPLTVAGVLLWGLWNPQDRLESVTAAVVNLDEPVELDGQTVPLGRVLAGELIAGDAEQNFTWVLTDEEDASAGLDDGRYATVVTIPENFSAAATSLSGDPEEAERATIDISESDRGRLIDTALSNIVTSTATSVLNRQLGEQFVGGVFVGMSELHGGISEAADGASQLADGGARLAEGAGSLADGTAQLASGTQQLAGGASELATGASAYVGGAKTLADSYAPLGAGATAAVTQLKTMIGALGQLQADSAAPQGQLAEGLQTVGAAVPAFAGDGTAQNPGRLGTLYGECLASGATQTFCDTMLAEVGGFARTVGGGAQQAGAGAAGLQAAQQTFQATIADPNAPSGPSSDPTAQLDQLIAGLGAFGAGLNDFAAQGAALSEGASRLAAGTSELAAGTPQLAEGASQLADGASQSATGAGDLATGLDEAAAEIPDYNKAQRDRIAETALAPVDAKGASDELFNSSGVPLFAGIALWAGALAAFLLLAPLWSRARDAARGVGAITLRSAVPAVLLGAVQGVLAGVILPIALGYDFGTAARFFGIAVLAGVAFSLVVQGLSALLGGLGRFIAFALLVVAFAAGIVSTTPGVLAAVSDASPLGAALGGFQSIATGGAAGGAALLLVLWGLGGLALTALAVARARRAH